MAESGEVVQKKVFSLINSFGKLSAAALAKHVEIPQPSLGLILKQLQYKDLIKTAGYGSSTLKGGKRPMIWQINPNYGNMLGLDVMPHAIRAVLVNMAGEGILRVEKEFSPSTPEKTISRIQNTIAEVLKEASLKLKEPHYIAIALPGLVDPQSHRIVHSASLGLTDFDLKSIIMNEFNIPTGIVKAANAGALGIQWYGNRGNLSNNILYVIYNPIAGGLDLGLLINQRLYAGSKGMAGEVAHTICSLKEIVETKMAQYPTVKALIPLTNLSSLQISDIDTGMANGCRLSTIVLEELIEQIASELCRITALFDPERIIIGGDVRILDFHSASGITSKLSDCLSKAFRYGFKAPMVERDHNAIFAIAKGATAMFLEEDKSLWL